MLLTTALFLAGCSQQDLGRNYIGPNSGTIVTARQAPAYPDGSEADALLRSQRLAKALADSKMQAPLETPVYHIGPGDILGIEVLSLEKPGETSNLIRTVDEKGYVNMSWAGKVQVKGLTTIGVEDVLKHALSEKFIKNPQVAVTIKQYCSAPVLITGAVTKPGVYYLQRDRRSILELLAEADGLAQNAGDELLIIRGGKSTKKEPAESVVEKKDEKPENLIVVDLKQLIDEGDLRLNLWIESGDMITVQPRAKEFIYVLGYVQRPGAYEINGGMEINVLQAIAMAGGLSSSARAQNSCLLRQEETGQKMIPMDLTKMANGIEIPTRMTSTDTLVVGSSFLARIAEFVKPSVSAGASVTPVP